MNREKNLNRKSVQEEFQIRIHNEQKNLDTHYCGI